MAFQEFDSKKHVYNAKRVQAGLARVNAIA